MVKQKNAVDINFRFLRNIAPVRFPQPVRLAGTRTAEAERQDGCQQPQVEKAFAKPDTGIKGERQNTGIRRDEKSITRSSGKKSERTTGQPLSPIQFAVGLHV